MIAINFISIRRERWDVLPWSFDFDFVLPSELLPEIQLREDLIRGLGIPPELVGAMGHVEFR